MKGAEFALAAIPGGRWKRIRDIVDACERDARPLTRTEFGQVLRDARVMTGWSLGDLGDLLLTTATALSNVERGLVSPHEPVASEQYSGQYSGRCPCGAVFYGAKAAEEHMCRLDFEALAAYVLAVAPLIAALRVIDAEQVGEALGDTEEEIRAHVRLAVDHAKRWSKALEAIMLADRDARGGS